jgi:hypothetical protein
LNAQVPKRPLPGSIGITAMTIANCCSTAINAGSVVSLGKLKVRFHRANRRADPQP